MKTLFFLTFLLCLKFSLQTNNHENCGSSIFLNNNKNATLKYSSPYFFEGVTPFESGDVCFTDIGFSVIAFLRGETTFPPANNIPVGRILCYDTKRDRIEVFEGNSGKAIGMQRDHNDNFIVACGADFGERSVKIIDKTSKEQRFISSVFNGFRYNSPNDVIVDPMGRILWTDPRYEGQSFEDVSLPQGRVYSWDPISKSVSIAIDDLEKGNGLVLNKESTKLYVADTNDNKTSLLSSANPGRRQVREYNYNVTTGQATFSRVLIDFAVTNTQDNGGADGLEIDDCGHLYVAYTHVGSGVLIFNITNGDFIDSVNLGPSVIAVNMKFGQRNRYRDTLYIVGLNFSFTDPRGLFFAIELDVHGVNTPRNY